MAADEEKQSVVMELKTKIDMNTSKLQQLEVQKRQNEINLRRAAFTAAHLDTLPDNVATYRQVGKAYVLEPKVAVMSHLQEVVETADKELKAAASTIESLMTVRKGLVKEASELMKK